MYISNSRRDHNCNKEITQMVYSIHFHFVTTFIARFVLRNLDMDEGCVTFPHLRIYFIDVN